MVSRILTPLVSQYVGEYVQELDGEKLGVGLSQGDLELQDVELNTGAVWAALMDALGPDAAHKLPFQLESARIDRMRVRVPWRHILGGGGIASAQRAPGEAERLLLEVSGVRVRLALLGDSHGELFRSKRLKSEKNIIYRGWPKAVRPFTIFK